ncbi:MAG: tRNA (guanosine(37)-N1)-methyltransferase TrmD [Deltaproteobacteria bacterium]
MRIDVITIFPEYFAGILEASLIGKGIAAGKLDIRLHQLRDWAQDKHHTVDDSPYGGGHGMVMKIEPLVRALEEVALPGAQRLLLAARGTPFTQQRAHELAEVPQLVLVCGRYEGVDERLAGFIDGQLGIGDYVLNGGEAAAAVVIDAVTRLVPGIIGNPGSLESESFNQGLLEYPQYTRPETFRDATVPPVLLSGNHAEIARWRAEQALQDTQQRRPDLLRAAPSEAPVAGDTKASEPSGSAITDRSARSGDGS